MTTDTRIIEDLQVRCLAYSLLRKYPLIQKADAHAGRSTLEDVQATAIKWARLLDLEVEVGEQAFRVWMGFFA